MKFRPYFLALVILFCGPTLQSTFSLSFAQTYFSSTSREDQKYLENLFRIQIAKTQFLQKNWNPNELVNQINAKGYNRSILKLACQTPKLNMALFDTALKFNPPLCGAESSCQLKFVDREIRRLDNYLASLIGEKQKLPQVSKGPLETERKMLLNKYNKHYPDFTADFAYIDHLVVNGASEELIRKELEFWQKGLEALKFAPSQPSTKEAISNHPSSKLVVSMRSLLEEIEDAFRAGDTDKTDDLYWQLLAIAEKTKDPGTIQRVLFCYETFLWGIRYRTREGVYDKRFRYVSNLQDKFDTND